MIRVLNFLLLALVVVADTQKCGDATYTSFIGELKEGQTIDQYCKCLQKYFDAAGLLKGKQFNCLEHPNVNKLEFKRSAYNEDTGCKSCLDNCENATSDTTKVCTVIAASERGIILPGKKSPSQAVAKLLRIRIIVIIVVTPRSITIYIGIYWG